MSLYTQDGFTDFCRGPHLPSTGRIPAFKLLSLAGAYWRGDEKNKMLTRIYGTAFPSAEALQEHLTFLEEVKKGTTGGSARSSIFSASPTRSAPGS